MQWQFCNSWLIASGLVYAVSLRMPELKHLVERFLFSSAPTDWQLCAVSADWDGEPLILFQEGKSPRPQPDAGMDPTVKWFNTPPKRHHLFHWVGAAVKQVTFENPKRLLTTTHIQPFREGWLIAEARGGCARICDRSGNSMNVLDLGDASEHVQTTADGNIWVGYFDEGVYGGGIGSNGLVCFDASGVPIFRYADFVREHDLPFMDDCYTLNVAGSSVWLSYYAEFPLVHLKNFELAGIWHDVGGNSAIAVRNSNIIIFPTYGKPYLISRKLHSTETAVWELADPAGRLLSKLAGGPPETTRTGWYVPFKCLARGPRFYVYDNIGLYELL